MKRLIKKILRVLGFEIRKVSPPQKEQIRSYPYDFSSKDIQIIKKIRAFTMTSQNGQKMLIDSVKYILKYNVPGSLVECGVWKGGSAMAMALTCLQEKNTNRPIYLYDTFAGMNEPTKEDKNYKNVQAETLLKNNKKDPHNIWCLSTFQEVVKNLQATGYPSKRIRFIMGPVEKTLPRQAPRGPIALLRLDTDWYRSTLHELEHLFPKLVSGGVLILDDYGCWKGARKATDEYFLKKKIKLFLIRVDESARIYVKT